MRRDLCNNVNILPAIPPAATTSDNTAFVSSIIPTAGYESLTFAIAAGSLADADATFAVTMEHGDASNLSDTTVPAATDLIGTTALASFTFAADNKTFKIGYVGGKGFVRMTVTPSNNTGACYVSAVAILGHPHNAPTANPPA